MQRFHELSGMVAMAGYILSGGLDEMARELLGSPADESTGAPIESYMDEEPVSDDDTPAEVN
jgi:hypothetical protein